MSGFIALFMAIAGVFAVPTLGELEKRDYPLRCDAVKLKIIDCDATIYELYEWCEYVWRTLTEALESSRSAQFLETHASGSQSPC
jgi:hypothetical protein